MIRRILKIKDKIDHLKHAEKARDEIPHAPVIQMLTAADTEGIFLQMTKARRDKPRASIRW